MENPVEKRIKDSRFLVTGGLGFVGSALAKRLLEEEAREVVCFDLKQEIPWALRKKKDDPRLKIVLGDICKWEEISQAISGCDYVFHQAGLRVTQCAKDPRRAHEVLVDGTFHVLQACVEHRIKKLIHASSAIVYGEPLRLPLDEDHPTHDTTFYGVFKVANENLLKSFNKQQHLDSIALRYFNIYGPGMNLFGPEVEVLVRWLDRIDSGQPPLIFGDGKQTLDWIFVDDVVEANWRAFRSGESGEVFNVCTGRETSVLEVLRLVLEIRGSRLEPEFQEARSVNQVARRFGSPEKAKKRIGFVAQVPLEEGLKRFIEWRDEVLARKTRKGIQAQTR